MCYIVAKKFNQEGSLVLEAEHGQRLASLSKYLTLTTIKNDVQIVTLNNLDSYREYAPYTMIVNEVEFISKVVKM